MRSGFSNRAKSRMVEVWILLGLRMLVRSKAGSCTLENSLCLESLISGDTKCVSKACDWRGKIASETRRLSRRDQGLLIHHHSALLWPSNPSSRVCESIATCAVMMAVDSHVQLRERHDKILLRQPSIEQEPFSEQIP